MWPAKPDLADFEPAEMARLETAMWRDYYAKHWLALMGDTWQVARSQYGFSRLDSLRLAWHATRAARAFQGNAGDATAVAAMTDYYRIVERGAVPSFDAAHAAKLEVRWWRERRESMTPDAWADTIAALTASIYGLTDHRAQPAAEARVSAMVYRDAHRQAGLDDAGWRQVEDHLTNAYTLLKQELRFYQVHDASFEKRPGER